MVAFIHSLAIVTPTTDGTLDDYGQPVLGDPTVTLVAGLVQPLRAQERPQVSQGGPELYDHRIFLALQTDPAPGAYIRFEPDDGDRYEIVGVNRFAFGGLAHLEVNARRIVSEALSVVSGTGS